MKRSRKQALNLAIRQASYATMMSGGSQLQPQNKDEGPQKRRNSGGYHKPGSNTK